VGEIFDSINIKYIHDFMMFWLIFIAIMAKFTVIPPHRCAEPNPPYQGPASVIEAQDPPRAGLIDP
jgi:hypothetical protein